MAEGRAALWRGGACFNNTGLCAGWRNGHALGFGRPNALLIPGPSGPGPARRAALWMVWRADGDRSAEPWALGQWQVPRGGVMSHRSWEPSSDLGVADLAGTARQAQGCAQGLPRAMPRALPAYKVTDVDDVEAMKVGVAAEGCAAVDETNGCAAN